MVNVQDQDLLNKLADDYDEHKGKLQDLGKTALKKSLIDHFTAERPDDPEAVRDLVQYHISRYHLLNVFESLCSNSLIAVLKVRDEDDLVLAKFGSCVSLQNYVIILAVSSLRNLDSEVLRESFKKIGLEINVKEGDVASGSFRYDYLEKNIGFKSGMHNYALQVAGLMYVACLRDDAMFWESFKPHMNILAQADVDSKKKEAKEFEKQMRYVVEAVPCFCSCVTATIK